MSRPYHGLPGVTSQQSVPDMFHYSDVGQCCRKLWLRSTGETICEGSKTEFAIRLSENTAVSIILSLADIRYLVHQLTSGDDKDLLWFDFFFEGEVAKVESVYGDSLRAEKAVASELMRLCEVSRGRGPQADAGQEPYGVTQPARVVVRGLRDAGCMLNFVAVRCGLDAFTASAVCHAVFPEACGDVPRSADDSPMPRWLLVMAGSAVVAGLGCMYAWFQIISRIALKYPLNMSYHAASRAGGGRGATTSSEDLTQEMISNLTYTQLIFLLRRIHKLCSHASDHARRLLADSPQLCMALLHAEFLAGASSESLLPLTSDEVNLAKERIVQLRGGFMSLSHAESASLVGGVSATGSSAAGGVAARSAAAALVGAGPTVFSGTGSRLDLGAVGLAAAGAPAAESARNVPEQVQELTRLLADLDPSILAGVVSGLSTEGLGAPPVEGETAEEVVDVDDLVQGLLSLSPEQIATLPESVQAQVLRALQSSV